VQDLECEAHALSGLADAFYAQGRLRSALQAFVRCVEICDREGLTRFGIANRCMIAIIEAYFGRGYRAVDFELQRERGGGRYLLALGNDGARAEARAHIVD